LILGHRGYRALYPENTLLAFRAALDAGADGVECDLQKTADGRYVVIHDPTPERTTGVSGVVARMSFEELRSLDAGRGERDPELGELLGALPPGTCLDLELKEETLSPRDCGAIAAILDNRFDRDRLMISSFVPRLLTPFRRRGYRVGLLVGERLAAFGALPLLPLVLLVRPGFVNLPVDMFRSLGERRARSLVALLRSLGLSVLFWTVNTESEAARIAGLADIVVTDEVEKMRRLVG
jgi:glycerophosphoryl diester phosphodiesterase